MSTGLQLHVSLLYDAVNLANMLIKVCDLKLIQANKMEHKPLITDKKGSQNSSKSEFSKICFACNRHNKFNFS